MPREDPTATLGVLGSGSWGTALATHLSAAGQSVILWARRDEVAEEIRDTRCNARYLPSVQLDRRLTVTADLHDLNHCRTLLVVVPSHGYRDILRQVLDTRGVDAPPPAVISATKGIETETLGRMSQVTEEEYARAGVRGEFAVLSGPTFAAELAAGAPTAAVIASHSEALATRLQEQLATPRFRLYSSTDVIGVEVGGTAKNVIAIAAGVVSGLGLGHNTLAALITRGLHEITRLGVILGGEERTFAGLAGLGDLVLTCTGGLSRNRSAGLELARGRNPVEIGTASRMVAEGVRNSIAIHRLAEREGIEMPITDKMVDLLYAGEDPRRAVEELMVRELKSESRL